MMTNRRISARFGIMLGLLVAGLLITSVPASANAIITRGSHDATIVTTVFLGDSLWMDRTSTTHFHAGHVCQFKADVSGVLRTGQSFYKVSAYEPSCILGTGNRRIDIYKAFKDGSNLCTQFFEYPDGWIPGEPCARIKA
jgi:hypothetical protein